jgi:hypothetical protein
MLSDSKGVKSLEEGFRQTAKVAHACMGGIMAHESEPGSVLLSMSKWHEQENTSLGTLHGGSCE